MICSLPEKRILFERRCYLLQLRLNLTNILPAFFPLQPFQSELYRMSFDQRVLSIGANVLCWCAALSLKALPPTSGMDPKEEDLLINLASMSRKRWLTFTTFKTRWYDPKSEICFTYTRILLFLWNILQKSSKNNETIARFSLLCSHWKFSLLNLRNLRRIIGTCCDKFSLHSQNCS